MGAAAADAYFGCVRACMHDPMCGACANCVCAVHHTAQRVHSHARVHTHTYQWRNYANKSLPPPAHWNRSQHRFRLYVRHSRPVAAASSFARLLFAADVPMASSIRTLTLALLLFNNINGIAWFAYANWQRDIDAAAASSVKPTFDRTAKPIRTSHTVYA